MSTHYYIYAEVRVKDKWYNLNPLMKKHDGSMVVRPIFDAASNFYDVFVDLESCRTEIGIPGDMSPELRSAFRDNLDEVCEGWDGKTTWRQIYERQIFCAPYSAAVAPKVIKDRPYKYSGYVNKRTIASFEVREIDEIGYWLTEEEYKALPDKEKKQYRYYQWNEDYDDYQTYRLIYERLCAMMYWFDYADAFEDRGEYWRNEPSLSDVRLFVETA